MAIYSSGINTTVTTTGAACADILASSTNSPKMMEMAVNMAVATASTYQIGRPGNDGSVAQTGGAVLNAENPGDPTGQTKTAVAWGTAPTVPTIIFRRITLPGTIGAGVIWTFPRGLTMPVSKGICLWNLAVNGNNVNVWFVIDE